MAKRVNIKGLSALKADLDELSTDIAEGTRKASEAVAEALAEDIRKRAPVDTGTLRGTVEADGPEVHVGGPQAPYAIDVEDEDPFIQPAVQAMIKKGDDIAAPVIRKEIT